MTAETGPVLFTADEVVEIANETSDSLGNLYRLDFIDRIRHEAGHAAAAGLLADPAATDWPCDNYTEPHTCLSVGCSETATCRICRIRAADRIVRAVRDTTDPEEQQP